MVRVTSRSGRMSEKWSWRPDDFSGSLDQMLPEVILFSFGEVLQSGFLLRQLQWDFCSLHYRAVPNMQTNIGLDHESLHIRH